MSSPLTEIFAKRGNVVLNFAVQKARISSFVPGSCPMKLLAGKARTSKPRSLYFW